MYELNTSWVLWYHSIKDNSWTKSSYKEFFTFTNLHDYTLFKDVIQLNHLQTTSKIKGHPYNRSLTCKYNRHIIFR